MIEILDTNLIPIIILIISALLCIGGLCILCKEKLVIGVDGEIIEIELPNKIKVKTNYPSVIAIVLGVCLAWIVADVWMKKPVEMMPTKAYVTLEGESDVDRVRIFVAAVPTNNAKKRGHYKPGETHEIDGPLVDKSIEYLGMAYVISSISEDESPKYIMDSEDIVFNKESEYGEFTAILKAE